MGNVLRWILCAVIGYGLGCFSTGLIVSKCYGRIDIRKYGSGNTGMTNVMRTLGWVPSFLTFAGDTLKGVAGALIGQAIGGEIGLHLGGLFAIVGHNWPAPYHFRGGKGMSTSFGYIMAADWRVGLILITIQIIVLLITGYMSLASLISSCAFVMVTIAIGGNGYFVAASVIAAALAIYSHRANIQRLKNGNENRLDTRKITAVSQKSVEKLRNRRKNKK